MRRATPLLLAALWACAEANTPAADATSPAPADGGVPVHPDATGPAPADASADGGTAPDAAPDPMDGAVATDVMFNGDFERDPARVPLNGACPQESRLGGFSVQMNEDVGYTAFDGVVRNGVIPNAVRDVVAEADGCRLLRRRRLTCDPPCPSGKTCGLDQMCVDAPLGQDMGRVRVLGLLREFEVGPQQPGNSYFFTRLPHPGVNVGAVVQLTAPMPQFLSPLELYGVGVRQLVPRDQRWVLTQGQALALHWEPPPAGARSSVYVEINIDLHGLTPLLLTCDVPDTGSATVAASMIDGLIGAGVTGFPEARVTRRTAASTTAPEGCVDFVVSSGRKVDLEVTGFIPCTGPADCPAPLTCDLAIQQCR